MTRYVLYDNDDLDDKLDSLLNEEDQSSEQYFKPFEENKQQSGQITNSSKKSEDGGCCDNCCSKVMHIAFYYILLVLLFFCILILAISIVVSYLFLLITVFIFFVSFITSYVMCPIYLSLDSDWLNFVAAIFQVFLSSPLVSFFLLFFVNLIKKVGDVIEAVSSLFQIPFGSSSQSAKHDATKMEIRQLCASIGLLIVFSLIGFLVFWTTFLKRGFSLLWGFLLLIPTLIEIVILMLPQYLFFVKLLFNKNLSKDFEQKDKTTRFLKCLVNPCIERVEIYDADSEDEEDKKISQATQTFLNGKGQVSPKYGYSLKQNDINDITKYVFATTEAKASFIEKIKSHLSYFKHVFFMKEFLPLYDYGLSIIQKQHHRTLSVVLLWIFTILNLFLIGFDINRAIIDYDSYFVTATVLRALVLPLFSYYHFLTHFLVKIKDKTLRIINHIAFCFTSVILIAIFACIAAKTLYKKAFRIDHYEYQPPDKSLKYVNPILLEHPLCMYQQYGITALEAFSYAIGAYDIIENPPVFREQMKTFFGENYSDYITVEAANITSEVPFVIYHNSLANTTILGFRSFNSGPEIAFLIQTIAEYYVIPFFTDLVPFMDAITDYFLDFPISIAHKFGRMVFDPTNKIKDYTDKIQEICIEKGIDKEERVLFAGIGTGGTLGKIASIGLQKYSISFLTLPLYTEFFENTFDLDENDMSYVTNVYVYESFFSIPEPEYATNIGIYPVPYENEIPKEFCNTKICDYSRKLEQLYPNICLIAGMCGENDKYNDFCLKALASQDDLDAIQDFVMAVDEED